MIHRFDRRSFCLGAAGAALATLGTGAVPPGGKRFIFVQALGGWDALCAFAPMFDAPLIQMDRDTAPLNVKDFRLVGSPNRPAVESFFRRFGDRTCLINGLGTRSIEHGACLAVASTGSLDRRSPDWATRLGNAVSDEHLMPHVNLGAEVFVGTTPDFVVDVRGRLTPTLDNALAAESDVPLPALREPTSDRLDQYLRERAAAEAARSRGGALAQSFEGAVQRAHALVAARDGLTLAGAASVAELMSSAVALLATRAARCVSITTGGWDSHSENKPFQTEQFQRLFTDLEQLLTWLDQTTTPDGTLLADETVVVVSSEMARTPVLNETEGRDHWPFTSALIIGPGIAGGRTIGGYDDNYLGVGVHPTTGERDPSRPGIAAESFGATLLTLGGLDPAEHLPGAEPLTTLLA